MKSRQQGSEHAEPVAGASSGDTKGFEQTGGNALMMETMDVQVAERTEPEPTGGQALPWEVMGTLSEAFGGADLSSVQVHVTPELQQAGVQAYTKGEHIFVARAAALSGDAASLELLGHELEHLFRQRAGDAGQSDETNPDGGQEAQAQATGAAIARGQQVTTTGATHGTASHAESPAQAAAPIIPIIIWGGKALAATTLDHFIDYAIAAILGLPSPGLVDDFVNFLFNAIPGLGEAKKVKKLRKLFKAIDKVVDAVKAIKKLDVPGSGTLLKNLNREAAKLRGRIDDLDLDGAKAAFGRLIGYVREGQVAAKVADNGGELMATGLTRLKDGTKLGTDIDVVFKEGGTAVFGQVKALNAAKLGPGSTSWGKFTAQADKTIEGAKAYQALEGVSTKVVYYVDDISDEARKYLEDKGVEIIMNANMLN